MIKKQILNELEACINVAKENTTCLKTPVGCAIGYIDSKGKYTRYSIGVNENNSHNCRRIGSCFRKTMHGSDSDSTKEFCKSFHATFIASLYLYSNSVNTAILTRIPCNKCVDLLCDIGVKYLYYNSTYVNVYARKTFEKNNVKLISIVDWKYVDDDNR